MAGRVEGKVAFITGAARGQGRSHAVRLAQEGADIIAVDLCEQVSSAPYGLATPEDLDETVRLVEAEGRRIIAAKADVRDREALNALLDDAVAELGHLDVVVPSAGIATYGVFDEITPTAWQEMIDINLTGVWNTCAVAKPHLIDRGSGSFVLTTSGAALRAPLHMAHYTSAKLGVIGLMHTIAKELAPNWIRANALSLTNVETPMIMNDHVYRLFRPDLDEPTKEDVVPVSTSLNMLDLPWIQPIDVSNAVLWLASDETRYVTGSVVRVDAGYGAM